MNGQIQYGLFRSMTSAPTREPANLDLPRRLAAFRHELLVASSQPSRANLEQLTTLLRELNLQEEDIEDELEEMRACTEALDLADDITRHILPLVAAHATLPAGDVCHCATPVRFGRRRTDQFGHLELYRFAVSKLIPDLTRAAAKNNKDTLVYTFSRQDFEKEYGAKYRRPGLFARFIVLLAKIMPRIGPFRTLAFDPPTPDAERLFLESFARARTQYRGLLDNVRANRLNLQNIDFDTGQPTRRGEYPLADETYAELVKKLAERKDVPDAMRQDINRFYGRPALP